MSSKSNVSKKRVQRTEDIDEDVESLDLKEKKEKKDKKEKKKDKKEKKSKKDKSKKQRTDTFSSSSTSHGSDSEEEPNPMAISNYNVSEGSRQVLKARGIECFFPIQAATFDHILDGNDVLGRARTGTGKTIAFALPIVERLLQDTSRAHGRFPRVIVMSPTRELAKQIEEEFISLARNLLSVLVIYGGTPYEPQERALSRGVDIVVGTPGRIIDHIDRGNLKLDFVSYAVLDEADKMLSVGFADEMDRVLHAIPRKDAAGNARKIQTLLFSATIPPFVQGLCNKYMSSEAVTVDLVSSQELKTSTGIRHLALQCQRGQRNEIIGDIVKLYAQVEIDGGRTIVFTDTKSDANELALNSTIASECAVLHGDIAQSQREITLKGFREGRFPILVATDVAARGLDIQGVALVINVRPPLVAEDYIHRSGRTGRAGTQGVCITFFSSREEHTLKQLERAAGVKFERIGAPQKSDIIGAVVKTSLTLLAEVHPTMIELFRKSAAEAIAARDGDAVTLLAAALAHVAGFTSEMKPKSLLEGEEGYTTIQLKSTVGATYRSPKFVLTILEGLHTSTRGSDANTLGVKGVRLATDGSALADVPSDMVPKLSEKIKRDPYARFEITVPSSLPDLQERPEREPRGGPSSGRFGGDRRDSRNGGRFGGSSGRGSGGFGGFGRPGSSSSNSRGRGRW